MTEAHEIQIYEDAAKEWRWRMVAGNGRIIADSGEGYNTREGAQLAAERFKEAAADAELDGGEEELRGA